MRRMVGYALAALLLAPVSVQAQQEPSNSMHTRSAEIYLDRAESASAGEERNDLLTKALEVLMEGAESDPGNPRIWFMAGQAYARMGDAAAADSAFDKAESIYPEYAPEIEPERLNLWITRYNQGVTALQAGDQATAMSELEAADRIYRGRPEAILMLGTLRAQDGNLEGAEEAYRAALEITQGPASANVDETDRTAWVEQELVAADRLATLLSQLGRNDEAMDVYRSVVQRYPDNSQAKADLAAQLAVAGQTDEAAALYESLLENGDLNDIAWFNAGVRLYSADQPELAAKAFRKSVEINPYSRDSWYNLGQALYARSSSLEMQLDEAPEGEKATLTEQVIALNEQLAEAATRIRELDPAFRPALMMEAQALRTISVNVEGEAARSEIQNQVVATLEAAEAMPFEVTGIQYRPLQEGSVAMSGRVTNVNLPAGETITLDFTLIGEDGEAVETHSVSVTAGEPDTDTPFDFEITTDATVLGWKYTIAS
jgi:tetratricopeptide (TPR) repeat protein